MGRYLGIDLGTTSITALCLDTESGRVLTGRTVSNDSEITSTDGRRRGYSEWDVERMVAIAVDILSEVAAQAMQPIEAIGVTGQQHGMVLLDACGKPITPFIGWQDRRCHEWLEDGQTYLARMAAMGDFSRSEFPRPIRGYMGSTLFWLDRKKRLPTGSSASFAADYLVSRLCDQKAVTDPTNAAGAGLYDVAGGCWDKDLIDALGLDLALFPAVYPSCIRAGVLSRVIAQKIGLSPGTPVTNACGDNQASFAGSVAYYDESVLVNIGTGGQISVYNRSPIRIEGLLLRPYLKAGYLLVGAGVTGGRAYSVLERFIRLVGEQVFGVKEMPDVFNRLNELASDIEQGAGGLECEPVFSGSLLEPGRRGIWRGVSDTNLTPGHMTRALLEGMATQFNLMYGTMQDHGVALRERFIGAGNGVRRNGLLAGILSASFQRPIQVVRHSEEAAFGAALSAAVAAEEFPDIEAAGRKVIDY